MSQQEALLGYARNRDLIDELQVRWSTGSTHPDYSTMTADDFGTDEYTVGDLTVAAIPAPGDREHHDPIWEVPDEPWTPDQTRDDDGNLVDPPGDQLVTAVFQAIGSGSMCWERVDRAGAFNSTMAKWVAEGLLAWIQENGWHQG